MPQQTPIISDIPIETLMEDPYPSYKCIHDLGSAVQVDSARIILVTRFQDIMTVERNHAIFASTNPGSLMNQVMGHSLMRKDDEPHQIERKAIEPSFRPGVVKQHWKPIFETICAQLIDGFADNGQIDLFDSFAAPMASLALIEMLGLEGVDWRDLAEWSQSLMDGVGNYHADPAITDKAKMASDSVNDAIDQVLGKHRAEINPSILSSMAHAQSPHSIEQIRANVKVIIGGGLNEPRDSMLTCILGLLQNPEQKQAVLNDSSLYRNAFEEAVRWVSPIGMYPRRVTQDTQLGDTLLKEGDQIGICVGAANRDQTQFENPDQFDIFRPRAQHLGFGGGPHFCAGTWVARLMVGEVAVPMIFDQLDGLRLNPDKPAVERGWVFRGPVSLPVLWDN